MINSIFRYSKGRTGPLEYLLNRLRVENGTSILMRGNADYTASLIKGSKFVHKYLSGGLMFGSDTPTAEQEQQIMDEFEKMVFVGLDKSQYNILWVKHVDKGSVELNYVIPKVDLSSGKSLDIFYKRRDLPLWNMWKNGVNAKHKFKCLPEDPARKRSEKERADGILKGREHWVGGKSFVTSRAKIWGDLKERAFMGEWENRDEMIAYLKAEGYTITRCAADSFSVKHESLGKKAKKLLGDIIFTDKFVEEMSVFNRHTPKKTEWLKEGFEPKIYDEYLAKREQNHLKKYAFNKPILKPQNTPQKKDKKHGNDDPVRAENTDIRKQVERRDRDTSSSRENRPRRAVNLDGIFKHGGQYHEGYFEGIAEAITTRKIAERSRDFDKQLVREIGRNSETIEQGFVRGFGETIKGIVEAIKRAKTLLEHVEEVLAAESEKPVLSYFEVICKVLFANEELTLENDFEYQEDENKFVGIMLKECEKLTDIEGEEWREWLVELNKLLEDDSPYLQWKNEKILEDLKSFLSDFERLDTQDDEEDILEDFESVYYWLEEDEKEFILSGIRYYKDNPSSIPKKEQVKELEKDPNMTIKDELLQSPGQV